MVLFDSHAYDILLVAARNLPTFFDKGHMGLDTRKPVFGGLRTAKEQTSLMQADQHLCC